MCRNRRFQKLTSILVLFAFTLLFIPIESMAENLTVKIVISPNTTVLPADSEPVVLTAQVSGGSDLTYDWSLKGPGTIDGTDLPGVFYMPPVSISGSSQEAVIAVKVMDKSKQVVKDSITLRIFAAEDPAEKPEQHSESGGGMSKGTKIALGVGALAAAGGVAALALGGGDDHNDDDGPFSGTFKRQFTTETTLGTPVYVTDLFTLRQNGAAINGTFEHDGVVSGCCTINYSLPITGTANNLSATLSWSGTSAECSCGSRTITSTSEAITASATLINNNSILQFEGGAEAVRQKLIGSEGAESVIQIPFGEFIRQ